MGATGVALVRVAAGVGPDTDEVTAHAARSTPGRAAVPPRTSGRRRDRRTAASSQEAPTPEIVARASAASKRQRTGRGWLFRARATPLPAPGAGGTAHGQEDQRRGATPSARVTAGVWQNRRAMPTGYRGRSPTMILTMPRWVVRAQYASGDVVEEFDGAYVEPYAQAFWQDVRDHVRTPVVAAMAGLTATSCSRRHCTTARERWL